MKNKDFLFYANAKIEDVLQDLQSSENGLTQEEALSRYISYGSNEMTSSKVLSWFVLIKNQVFNPFIFILFIIAFIYLFSAHYIGASIVLLIFIINVMVGLYQEYQSNKIKKLLNPHFIEKIEVLRAGKKTTITTDQLVIGDILFLQSHTIVPADCRLLKSENIIVNESHIMGSSVAVKSYRVESTADSIYNSFTCCFTGTAIVEGTAIGIVFATGDDVAIVSIQQSSDYTMDKSTLVQGTMHLSYMVLFFIFVSLALVFFINMFIERELATWLEFILFSAALAISAMPSSVPGIMTFCLTKCAINLYHKEMIIRRLTDIEDLGGLEVLCIDEDMLLSEKNEKNRSFIEATDKAKKLGIQIKLMSSDKRYVEQDFIELLESHHKHDVVITAAFFEESSEEEKMILVHKGIVFLDMSANQKSQIIAYLQRKYSVGYMSDSTIDASLFTLANVGIVSLDAVSTMRETAKVIVLKKNLYGILDGIEECRKILINTLKYVKVTLSSNLGNFYSLAFSSLLINYMPMLPLQLLFLDLVSDFPLIALPMDSVSEEVLAKPLHFSAKDIFITLLFGLISSPFAFMVFILFKHHPGTLQTNWFISSVLMQLVLIFSLRLKTIFWRKPAPLRLLLILCFVLSVFVVCLPFTHIGQHIFLFVEPNFLDLGKVFFIVGTYFITMEMIKLFYYRNNNQVSN